MSKRPDTKAAALLGIVRRELNLTTGQAGHACGRSQELITNMEVGVNRMADEPCRALCLFYLDTLGAPARQPQLPVEQLIEEMARALLLRRARRATELLAASESGALALTLAVINEGLHADRWTGKVIRRLKYRLESEARKMEGASGGG